MVVRVRGAFESGSISGGETEPFLEVIFRPIMKKNKNAPISAQWVWGIDWRKRIFMFAPKRFWGLFGGLLAFGYYLDRDFLMFFR